MAVDFSSNWSQEIADVTESAEYQTCTIRIDWDPSVLEAYDVQTAEYFQVEEDVSEAALETTAAFHFLQDVLSNPDSTQQEQEDANDTYLDSVLDLLDLVSLPIDSTVTVSSTAPEGDSGDVWIRVVDRVGVVLVYGDDWEALKVDSEVYSGQARFIPVRAGVWQGGEAQLNATTIRAVRFQLPRSELSTRIHAGAIVTITAAPFNANLKGRTAKVNDDFQGATAASRTFHATMDADSEDS